MVSFLYRLSLICDIWRYLCITWSPRRSLRLCMYIHSLTFESNNSHQKTINNLGESGMFCALQHVLKLRPSNCVTCVPLQPQTNLPEANLFTLLNSPIFSDCVCYISQKKRRQSQNSHADNFSRLKNTVRILYRSMLQNTHTFTLLVFYLRQQITNLTSEMAS